MWLTKQKDPSEATAAPKSPRSPRSPRTPKSPRKESSQKANENEPSRKLRLRKQLSEDYSTADADDIPLDEVIYVVIMFSDL